MILVLELNRQTVEKPGRHRSTKSENYAKLKSLEKMADCFNYSQSHMIPLGYIDWSQRNLMWKLGLVCIRMQFSLLR
jgi:hypothetical protein